MNHFIASSYINSKKKGFKPRSIILFFNCCFLLSLLLPFYSAKAATAITVTTNLVNAPGGLAEAIADANTTPGHDTIVFANNLEGQTIALNGSELNITESLTITGPVASNAGGIIMDAEGLSRHFNASSFVSGSGGNITLENLTLINGKFSGTGTFSDDLGGGSLFVKNVDLTLNHVKLNSNSTNMDYTGGGAIYMRNGVLNVNNSTLSNNSTSGQNSYGGAAYKKGGTAFYKSTLVTGNATTSINAYGGGIYSLLSDTTIENSNFISNSTAGASASGGAIGVFRGNSIIRNSQIINNRTTGTFSQGGGIHISSSSLNLFTAIIESSTIAHNKTLDAIGGGLSSHIPTTITNSSFTNNSGGGIYLSKDLTLNQTTVSGNSGYRGGAIHVQDSSTITMNNSTIVNNFAAVTSSCGIYFVSHITPDNYTVILNNSILAGNCSNTSNIDDTASNVTIVSNHSIFGDPSSKVDTDVAMSTIFTNTPDLGPLQFNGGAIATNKPNANSSTINAGDNTLVVAFNNDQRGSTFPRVIDGIVDIGAIELQNVSASTALPLNPDEILTRRDLAREMLKQQQGLNYTPPPATGNVYSDVNIADVNADWIEDFAAKGYTEGCATNKFCPNGVVTRAEISKIELKVFNGMNYTPPQTQVDTFTDVPPNHPFYNWIEQIILEGFTDAGCATNKFCPNEPVTRVWFESLLNQF